MGDILGSSLVKNSWVPVWQSCLVSNKNEVAYGTLGYWEEFRGLNAVVVPLVFWEEMKGHEYCDFSPNNDHRPWKNHGIYYRPMEYVENNLSMGDFLVVQQQFDRNESPVLRINQDFILALRLKEEGKYWVRPEEGYEPVVRIRQDNNGNDCEVDIKLPFLKDYLCARECRLLVAEFFQRVEYISDLSNLPFLSQEKPSLERPLENGRWDCWFRHVDENGNLVDGDTSLFTMRFVEKEDPGDTPQFSPERDAMQHDKFIIPPHSTTHVGVFAECRRMECVCPAERSPRVLLEDDSVLSFIATTDGAEKSAKELARSPHWLYFKSGIIQQILTIRNSALLWYSKDTGAVRCGDVTVHFGVNDIGLITVFAKDIADLPRWLQDRWRGFNVVPEGGVSKELLASQMYCNPAKTKAPEVLLPKWIKDINDIFLNRHKKCLFSEPASNQELVQSIHRFRVQTEKDLYALAKDIIRLTSDNINQKLLRDLLLSNGKPESDIKEFKSNKLLESFWELIDSDAPTKISTLFYLYEMRLGDSHPFSESFAEAANKLGLTPDLPLVKQGEVIIGSAVNVLSMFHSSLIGSCGT